MDRHQALHCFCRVVETGGFAAAARDLDLSASLVEQVLSEIPQGDFQVTPKTMLDVLAHVNEGSVDWDSFQKEYPWVGEAKMDYRNRLRTALFAIYANQEKLTDAEKPPHGINSMGRANKQIAAYQTNDRRR